MADSQDAYVLMTENVGWPVVPSVPEVNVSMFVNVGWPVVPSVPEANVPIFVNVGFQPPTSTQIVQPQIGWGVPVTPQRDATLVLESSNPTVSMFVDVIA